MKQIADELAALSQDTVTASSNGDVSALAKLKRFCTQIVHESYTKSGPCMKAKSVAYQRNWLDVKTRGLKSHATHTLRYESATGRQQCLTQRYSLVVSAN